MIPFLLIALVRPHGATGSTLFLKDSEIVTQVKAGTPCSDHCHGTLLS